MSGPVKPYTRSVVGGDEYEVEIRLWRSVVMQAISDSLDPLEKQAVMEWLLSVDFEVVAGNAQLDESKLKRLVAQVVLGKKPDSIINANKLKMMIEHGALDVI